MDTIWCHISKKKSLVGNNDHFSLLFKSALVVLLIPHSNASIEKVFFLINKTKSEGSSLIRLKIEGSLSSIMAVKLERSESVLSCLDYNLDDKLLQGAEKRLLIITND